MTTPPNWDANPQRVEVLRANANVLQERAALLETLPAYAINAELPRTSARLRGLAERSLLAASQLESRARAPEALSPSSHPGVQSSGLLESIIAHQDYFSNIQCQGLAPTQNNPLNGNVFIDVTIENLRFQGVVNKFGPYITRKNGSGTCHLGAGLISCCPNGTTEGTTAAWHVCKPQNQWRIDLSALTDAGRRALAFTFGLILKNPGDAACLSERPAFYASVAFTALQDWAKLHPRKIEMYGPNEYLGAWPQAACDGVPGCAESSRQPLRRQRMSSN